MWFKVNDSMLSDSVVRIPQCPCCWFRGKCFGLECHWQAEHALTDAVFVGLLVMPGTDQPILI